jgi:hypothetical protein
VTGYVRQDDEPSAVRNTISRVERDLWPGQTGPGTIGSRHGRGYDFGAVRRVYCSDLAMAIGVLMALQLCGLLAAVQLIERLS